jgi:hypothetical protein
MNRTSAVATMIQAVSAPFIPVSPNVVAATRLRRIIGVGYGMEQR